MKYFIIFFHEEINDQNIWIKLTSHDNSVSKSKSIVSKLKPV